MGTGDGEVVLVCIHVRDSARAEAFYRVLFGWVLDGGAFRTPGGLRGVFRKGAPSTAGPELYVRVPKLEAALARAVSLGGTPLVRPGPGPDGGRIAQVLDPEGNRIGLWEGTAEGVEAGDLHAPGARPAGGGT
jgi:predicted enzyme related to lactoylglutathione lyase